MHLFINRILFCSISSILSVAALAQEQKSQPGNEDSASETHQDDGLLPTPAGLERDVLFWEKVIGDTDPEDCVFHDEWNLDVIYYSTRVPRVTGNKSNPNLKRHLTGIRLALDNISARGRPAGDFEEKIYASVPERIRTREFFREAGDRLRCQRGVEFAASFKRSRHYISMIKDVLREKGLPEDLAYLPHLESGFNVKATSKAGAKGLWQFMPHTARAEGLKVRRGKDWRVDPIKSTDAATNYLASIFSRVKSWELTITSYNYGPNGVMRAIQKFGPDYMKIRSEHKTRIFGFAARNYYPSFLAARNVAMREEERLAATTRRSATIAEDESRSKKKAASTF